MGHLWSRAKALHIQQLPGAVPVLVSVNGNLAQLKSIAPLTVIDVRFNQQYSLRWLRHSGTHISLSYANTESRNGLNLVDENTFKEGHTLNITFRPRRGPGASAVTEVFDWYTDLTAIRINLIT
jgi:hypothetical protein